MKDVIERHDLSDGRAVWIQRHKVPGIRRASWSVVVTGHGPTDAPDILPAHNKNNAHAVLADILRADLMDEL